MRTCKGTYSYAEAVGIFVELTAGEGSQFRYGLSLISPYRVKLQIALPPGLDDAWPAGIAQILRKVEAGTAWPVRFDYENLTRFISVEDAEKIEKRLPGATLYIYGVKTREKESFDAETLRCWKNAAARAAYIPGGKPALDGQFAFDLG